MYLRFISPLRSRMRGVDLGIFQCAIDCRENTIYPAYLRTAIREETDWFNEYLPAPKEGAFGIKSRKRMINVGICWFKCSADEMINHAFALKALLGECGVGIKIVGTKYPGQILYVDDFQIVAKPDATTPTKWG